MGCAASKNMDEALIKAATDGPPQEMSQVQATAPTEPDGLETGTAEDTGDPGSGPEKQEEETVVLKKEPTISTNSLEKPVMPEIRSSKGNVSKSTELPKGSKNSLVGTIEKRPERPVAFEIPVDELKPIRKVSSAPKSNSTSTKSSLPKLQMSEAEIAAKLLNAEDRWKDLEKEQDARRKSARSRRGASARSDPEELKTKLEEKEAKAEQNRQRELAKKQSEQEKRDSHIKKVRERKKQMGKDQAEEAESDLLNLSWGGETGGSLMDAADSSNEDLKNSKSHAET